MLLRGSSSNCCSRLLHRRIARSTSSSSAPASATAAAEGQLSAAEFDSAHLQQQQQQQQGASEMLVSRLLGSRQRLGSRPGHVGLLQLPQLVSEHGFGDLVQEASARTGQLVAEAISAQSERRRPLVQVFDEMSDTLCRVADMADCVRQLHPSASYRAAAEEACVAIATLVESLNTNRQLYDKLQSAVAGGELGSGYSLDSVDQRVAELFLADFQLSGIDLPAAARAQFVQQSQRAFLLGAEFARGAGARPKVSQQLYDSLCDSPDALVRRRAFISFYTPCQSQERLLTDLLDCRHSIAGLTGFTSYADRANAHAILPSAKQIESFLLALAERLRPAAQQEAQQMQVMMQGVQPTVCDLVHLSHLQRAQSFQGINEQQLEEYFSVGSCVSGVDFVLRRLFNVCLQLQQPLPGEVWHSSVTKLSVINCADSSLLGHIYCDFYPRPDKPQQECHFTIQGGRQLPDGQYQLPIVCLQLQCPAPTGNRPSLLPASSVENLFHEFGHAVHSMLGRTRYQHVTGTRCGTDFAEVPSTLLEMFAFQPAVLAAYARHWRTGHCLPERARNSLRSRRHSLAASMLQQQVLYSLFDIRLHSGAAPGGGTVPHFHSLAASHFCLRYPPGTAWHHTFAHLVSYGAKYYAYLVSKSITALIWSRRFSADPLCQAAGRDLHKFVLARGGEQCPISMVQSLTGCTITADLLADAIMHDLPQ